MKINVVKPMQVDAKTLKIHMKVCDQFSATLEDQNGEEIKDYEGYVPDFMPGTHYGDYLILEIDIDTGKIMNWRTPSPAQIEAFVNGEVD
jgi:hypothetical protein